MAYDSSISSIELINQDISEHHNFNHGLSCIFYFLVISGTTNKEQIHLLLLLSYCHSGSCYSGIQSLSMIILLSIFWSRKYKAIWLYCHPCMDIVLCKTEKEHIHKKKEKIVLEKLSNSRADKFTLSL